MMRWQPARSPIAGIMILPLVVIGSALAPLSAQSNPANALARGSTVQQRTSPGDTGIAALNMSGASQDDESAFRPTVRQLNGDTLVVRLQRSQGRDWTPVVIALVSIAASVLATAITARQKNRELAQALALKQQELDRTLGMRLREQERAELTRRLTTFLGPLKQQLELAFVLYRRLCQGDPERRTREGFRTLVALLSGAPFSENDRAIIEELVATTSAIRQLIMRAEGYVEDEELLRVLSTAAAHFRLLELAATGKIKGEVERFDSSTYPRELDDLVDAEIARLRAKLEATAHT